MRKILFLFGQLGDEDVEWLRRTGAVHPFAPGDVLIEQGRQVEAVFIVLHGTFAVSTRTAGQVAEVGAGEILGEMSFIDSRPTSATVRATTDAAVLTVAKELLSRRIAAEPLFAARFYRALALFLSDRLRAMEDGPTGELDIEVLEQVTQAGNRFDAMVRALLHAVPP